MVAKPKQRAKPAIAHRPIRGLHGMGLIQLPSGPCLELRDRLRMPRVLFGRVVNVSERTIAKIESEDQQVEKLMRPYNEVYRLYRALNEVIESDALGEWFITPNSAFDGLKPVEVIERGEIDRLWEAAYRLRSGQPG